MTILQAKNVSYFYQDGDKRRMILQDTSINFDQGQFYTILGQSGSGKTTFLSLISALDEPKSGEVLYKGQNIKEIGLENTAEMTLVSSFKATI